MSLLPELRYPSVTELVSSARALAAHRPGLCALRQVGVSRAGRPLHLLSVGHAQRAVLVVAGAHANEPTGGSTLLALAERVVAEVVARSRHDWVIYTHHFEPESTYPCLRSEVVDLERAVVGRRVDRNPRDVQIL